MDICERVVVNFDDGPTAAGELQQLKVAQYMKKSVPGHPMIS